MYKCDGYFVLQCRSFYTARKGFTLHNMAYIMRRKNVMGYFSILVIYV
jgi:uncharacterized protein (UPF0303 family)